MLLRRSPSWHPWLRVALVLAAVIAVVLIVASLVRRTRLGAVAVATTMIFVALAGPAAYALNTASTAHAGAIPSAGPAVAGGFGPGGPGGPGGFGGGAGGGAARRGFAGGLAPTGNGGGGFGRGGFAFGGGATGFAGAGRNFPGGGFGGGTPGPGGAGGLLNGSTPSAALTATLKADSGRYTWVAAAVGSNEASGYQLATGDPVMAIGGFNGTDPAPTLAQFETYVQEGKIHYFIGGGAGGGFGGGGPGGGGGTASTSSQIRSWVAANFSSRTVGGVTLYDLTAPTSSSSGG
jgi:hypothetical protein